MKRCTVLAVCTTGASRSEAENSAVSLPGGVKISAAGGELAAPGAGMRRAPGRGMAEEEEGETGWGRAQEEVAERGLGAGAGTGLLAPLELVAEAAAPATSTRSCCSSL